MSTTNESNVMNRRQILEHCVNKMMAALSETELEQLLDFAHFLSLKAEGKMWSGTGTSAVEAALNWAEDDYGEADVRSEAS